MQKIIINASGTKYHFNDSGLQHREDGPAVEYPNGFKYWYINGMCHREDGPAVEGLYEYKEWCINDKFLTEEQFNEWRKDNNK